MIRKNDELIHKREKRQGICLVKENCSYNMEFDSHNYDLFNVL